MISENGIWAIAKREFKRICSSKICIWGMMVVPLLSMLILTYMMHDGLPNKIPIAVVDMDNTTTSRALIRQLDAFPKTDIKFKSLSFRDAREKMERAEVYAVLTIPKDFSRDAISGAQPKLAFYTNNAFLISGSLLFQDLKTVCVLASAAVGLKTAEAKGITQGQIMPVLQPIVVESHPLSNPYLNYSLYLNNVLLPGVLQLVILLFTISSFGSEVKSGSGRMLVEMGNNSSIKLIIGKLLPYTFFYLVLALLFMSVLYGYNGFPMKSGFLPMFLNYVCLIISSQALAVILLGVFPNYRFALSASSLLGILGFSMSGVSFPVLSMNPMLQGLSNIFPIRHFFLVYVDQGLNGLSMGYSTYHYAAMLFFVFLSFLFYGRIKNFLFENKYEE